MKGNVYDYEGLYMLLAATVKLARRDAKRDPAAADWLDCHCPQWRRYEVKHGEKINGHSTVKSQPDVTPSQATGV